MLVSFMCMLDLCRRHTDLMNSKQGQFCASGLMSVACFWLVWPFEFLKNQIHAERNNKLGKTNLEKVRNVIKQYGVKCMYKGLLPGTISIFTRNGASMVVM